jgi:hypothetical protein
MGICTSFHILMLISHSHSHSHSNASEREFDISLSLTRGSGFRMHIVFITHLDVFEIDFVDGTTKGR